MKRSKSSYFFQDRELVINMTQLIMEAVSECRRSIASRSIIEIGSDDKMFLGAGDKYICDAIKALYVILYDHEEIQIRSDCDDYFENIYKPKVNDLDKDDWFEKANLNIDFFDYIMKVLNKYGLLLHQSFKTTNVEIQPVK